MKEKSINLRVGIAWNKLEGGIWEEQEEKEEKSYNNFMVINYT